jgi:hypothetical protein
MEKELGTVRFPRKKYLLDLFPAGSCHFSLEINPADRFLVRMFGSSVAGFISWLDQHTRWISQEIFLVRHFPVSFA